MCAWKPATLTASSRPTLLPGESELAVQASIGLYENKLKAAAPYQAGRVYLTTHRLVYVPDEDSKRRAIEMALARVKGTEFYNGFMRSSAKITIRIKPPDAESATDPATSYKLSFRNGGERFVYEQFKLALTKAAWKIDTLSSSSSLSSSNSLAKTVSSHANGNGNSSSNANGPSGGQIALGIHGLQLSTEHKREHNNKVLGSALEDLNSLMQRAQEVVRLAEDYAKILDKQDTPEAIKARRALQYSTQALGISSIDSSTSTDDATFHAELARQIADFLLSDAASSRSSGSARASEGVLASEGGIITLIDLFAVYNRARGVSLISPNDLYQACLQFDKLGLGIRLRTFASGLRVVQESYRTEEVITRNILELINKYKKALQAESVHRKNDFFGITAIYVSEKLKWSVMIATEELEIAERNGTLCRDDQLSGTTFYENDIPTTPWNWRSELFNE